MREVTIIHCKTKQVVGRRIAVANSFFRRFKGLMFQKSMGEYNGLLLTKTKQIHMFWMRFAIDVLYVRRGNDEKEGQLLEVVDFVEKMKPWKVGRLVSDATDVIELQEGTIAKKRIKIGTLLLLKNI